MAVTSYPGVYIEEVPGGARPIEAAGTSTAAFFGVADKGPIGEVRKIFSFSEFEKTYGGFRSDGQFLAHGVYQFFNNGGRDCYVGRVAANHVTASISLLDRVTPDSSKAPALEISAISPGAWANQLLARVESAATAPNVFTLRILRNKGANPLTSVANLEPLELHENLSMDPNSGTFVASVVNRNSTQVRVKVLDNSAHAIAGYSESDVISGADSTADFITANQRKFRININGDGWQTVDLTTAMSTRNAQLLGDIQAAIELAIRALTPQRTTNAPAYRVTVTLTAAPRKLRITSGAPGINSRVEIAPAEVPSESVTAALRLGPKAQGLEVHGHTNMRPMDADTAGYFYIGADSRDTATPLRVADAAIGSDGDLPQPLDYAKAFHWLDKKADVSLLAVPGVGASFVADSGMAYCRNRPLSDCFFIADMPSYYDELDEAKQYASDIQTPNSYGAAYFPWLKMPDPTGLSPEPIAVPPSGFVAGLYAQTDARRGVWKAPAGLEAAIAGAVDVTAELTDQQQGDLNKVPKSVCVIRKFQRSGMVVWGARTLSTDPEYKYIPVRRTAIMLRKSIYDGIQWAVFEGNDERLWSSLRLNISSFMNGLFRAGAFQGSKASDAYFVRCGLGSTMTQDDIDRGEVLVEVGFAPLKPAEFVIVRIQQKVAQAQ